MTDTPAMRVLLLCEVTGNTRGGVVTELIHLVNGLRAEGVETAVWVDQVPEACGDVRYYPLTWPARHSIGPALRQALSDFKPDVIHALALGAATAKLTSQMLERRPWMLTIHHVPPLERIVRGVHGSENVHYLTRFARYLPNIVAWSLMLKRRVFPKVIVHSELIRGAVIQHGYPSDRISMVPIGLDIDSLDRARPSAAVDPQGPLRLTTVGGFAHTKGQHDLIEAALRLRPRWPNLHLDLVGDVRDHSYLRFLQRLVRRSGLSEIVHFHISAANALKARLLTQSDVYVQPSHEEGFCIAFAEACFACPRVVGTNTGAIARIAGQDPGTRVVPIRAPVQLAEAIDSVAREEVSDAVIGIRRLRNCELLSWNRYVSEHLKLYRQIKEPCVMV